jgi:hypothetical protein
MTVLVDRDNRLLNPKFFVRFNPDKLNPEFIVFFLESRGPNPHQFGARVNSVLKQNGHLPDEQC